MTFFTTKPNTNYKLQNALLQHLWVTHSIGDEYTMDNLPDRWKIVYYPIFSDNKTKEEYVEARCLVEKPIKGGIDFREVPLRYLTRV